MTNSRKIIEYLKERIGHSLKLLFMPYKRDMWDALEGVYHEALKEGFKCDILPIPYTYRDHNGEFTEWMVDEFDNSREGFPVKDEYDVILFHNPYDEYNRVTSVKPEYYTSKLVGLSKALCLVPYGIGVEGNVYPGIYNADVIFAENELTVESILNEAKELGMTDKVFRQKFVVTGSPKCDLDLNQEVPEEWKEKIKGKRVVLFTTSLVPLLKDPQGEITKYDAVLTSLMQDESQIVIWREHPLTQATIKAMIPQFYPLYSALKRGFITYGHGIFDETHDYRIAFSVADVLYSVPSSIIEVWKVTGKEFYEI